MFVVLNNFEKEVWAPRISCSLAALSSNGNVRATPAIEGDLITILYHTFAKNARVFSVLRCDIIKLYDYA